MLQTYKVRSHQSIFDVLVSVQVPLDSIVTVLRQSDLDFDSELTGEEVLYETTQVQKVKGGQKAVIETPDALTYTTNSTQNIYDVCLMTVGDLNKLVQLISSNEIFNSINDAPNGVKVVNYSNSDITDSGFKLALKKSNINITTGNIRYLNDSSGFLLMESTGFVLQEDESKIIL